MNMRVNYSIGSEEIRYVDERRIKPCNWVKLSSESEFAHNVSQPFMTPIAASIVTRNP